MPGQEREIKNQEVVDLMKFLGDFLQNMEGSKVNKYSINGFWLEANNHLLKLENALNESKKSHPKAEEKKEK